MLLKSNCKRSCPPPLKHDWLLCVCVCLFVCLFVCLSVCFCKGSILFRGSFMFSSESFYFISGPARAPDWGDITWRGLIITKTQSFYFFSGGDVEQTTSIEMECAQCNFFCHCRKLTFRSQFTSSAWFGFYWSGVTLKHALHAYFLVMYIFQHQFVTQISILI